MSEPIRLVDGNHVESFASCRKNQSVIEADEIEGRRTVIAGGNGGCQLQGIRGAEIVDPQEASCDFPDPVERLNFLPAGLNFSKPPQCGCHCIL